MSFPLSALSTVASVRVGCVCRPSEGVAQPSDEQLLLVPFCLGFGFHPTGNHCLETPLQIPLQQSPFSMVVLLSPCQHPAAKNHSTTCCSICYNSPPSLREGRITFITHFHHPLGSLLPEGICKYLAPWSPWDLALISELVGLHLGC